jgi:hypothetical protein
VVRQVDIVWDFIGNLSLAVEECSTGTRDPGGEEASLMWWCGVVWMAVAWQLAKTLIWVSKVSSTYFVLILMALDVEDVNL